MSKLIDKKLADYINDVDSSLPAPGGGSVMGAVGSLACALAGMVGHLTVNKKKFLELSQEEQDNFNNAIENIRNIKSRLMEIVDKDAESFNAFMEAMKLPKNTEEEKAKRKTAISDAAKKLSEVKFDILPKRAVSDPQKDSFIRKCAYGDNPDGECFSAYGGFVC